MTFKRFNVLLVDDCEEDIDLLKHALLESGMTIDLSVAANGEDALMKLNVEERDYPDLILLDLNMPRINGHEVLKRIKHHDRLKKIPVIILTTSRSPDDILKCYNDYSNCYVCKPLDFDSYHSVVEKIREFWLELVVLPTGAR